MTFMRNRTYFDAESGSIMDLPRELQTKRAEEVRIKAKAATWHSKNRMRWTDDPAVVTSIVVETLSGERREIALQVPAESVPEDERAPHRYGEKWNQPGEFAAYRERVEAQFSAPVKRDGDAPRAISIVISGFPASGKSTIGRIIARALKQSGIRVKTMGQRATLGIADVSHDAAELDRIRLSPVTEPMEVEIWEVDQAAPNNH